MNFSIFNFLRVTEEEFRRYLQVHLPPEDFKILADCCRTKPMSSFFGWYDTLEVSWAPSSDPNDRFPGELSESQRQAFYKAMAVLKTAPLLIRETIRTFCHC